MTKAEIKEQLAAKEQELQTILKDNNLDINTALTTEQLAVVQQVHQALGIAEVPQDIGKKAFVDYVQDWVGEIQFTLKGCDRTDVEVSVPTAKTTFIGYIRNKNFPISSKLWKGYIEPALNNLGESVTPKVLADTMYRALDDFNQAIQNKFELTKHYKENKATYRKIKKKELEGVLMTPSEFNDWLLKAIETAETKNNKEEEQLELEYRRVVFNYLNELAAQVNNVTIIDPTHTTDTLNVDVKAMFRNLSRALDDDQARHAPIGKSLWGFVNENLSSQPYYELQEVRDQMNRWCRSSDAWKEAQFKYWKKSKEGFPNPTLIAEAINDACINISADTIQQHLVEWTKRVKDAFVMSKNYNIVIEKAQKNFKELFDESSNKGVPTLFFYSDILEGLFQANGEKARLEQLKNSVWEKALLQVVEKKRVADYFGAWREKYGPYAIKEFNLELDTLLPTTEEIQQAILKSVERKQKLIVPEIEVDTLRIDLVLRSKKLDNYENRKKLLVDLAYKNYPTAIDGTITDLLVAVPTKVEVQEGNNEESKSDVQIVDTKIKKTTFLKGGSARTTVKLTFVAVTDVEKLFDEIDIEDISYKGKNLGGLLKKLELGASHKGAGIMMGVEDFIYKSTNADYFVVEFTVGSNLVDGKDKVIDLQTSLNSTNSAFKATFGDGSKFLGGHTFLRPAYEYK